MEKKYTHKKLLNKACNFRYLSKWIDYLLTFFNRGKVSVPPAPSY